MFRTDELGDPALSIAGFRLWVHGRQFPDAEDYWDGNWLNVTAVCDVPGARVSAQGAIVMVTDLERFGSECERLLGGGGAKALHPIEPELRVELEVVDRLGHLRVRVEMSPQFPQQHQCMEFEVDQSYLPGIIAACAELVRDYPIRGASPPGGP